MPLYVLATPIGNLGDLSPRAREILAGAQVVGAEDTRVTRKLYAALGLPAPELKSYRGHDEARRAGPLADRVAAGQDVVLVSDAGTPAVSDPGLELVRLCHQRGLSVRVVPGPSAAAAALSVSGLPPVPAQFLAFSPRKPGPLRRWLTRASQFPGSTVFFEAPRRAAAAAEAIAALMPDREVCLCRELTKVHEEILLLPAPEMARELAAREEIKGEIAFVIGPGAPVEEEAEEGGDDLKAIAALLARRWGVTKREAYQKLLQLEREL
jgi:16S rRNA (cytidine1402-2'-O)-methyltransferase